MPSFFWTQKQDIGPSSRTGHGLTYDGERKRVLLFGGDPGGPPLASNYAAHVQNCENVAAATFAAHPNDANFHQYMHVVFRLRDQFGAGIADYDRATERFGTLPANSSEASLRLNSATSAAKMYRLFAIKCVRSHPRFS